MTPATRWILPSSVVSDTATWTASSADANLPASNVTKADPGQVLRFAGYYRIRTNGPRKIDFNDPVAGNVTATVTNPAAHTTPGAFATTIGTAMDSAAGAGAGTYTASWSVTTGKWTIARSSSTFTLLWGSGPTPPTESLEGVLGWGSTDTGAAASHTAPEIRVHTEETLYVQATVPSSVDAILALYGHWLSATADVRLYMNLTALDFALMSGTQTRRDYLTANATDLGAVSINADDYNPIGRLAFQSLLSTHWYLSIVDRTPRSSAPFQELGRVVLGTHTQPTRGPTAAFGLDLVDPTEVSESVSGRMLATRLPHLREWSGEWRGIDDAERARLEALARSGLTPQFLWWARDETDGGTYVQVRGAGARLRIEDMSDDGAVNRWGVGPLVARQIGWRVL